MAKFVTLDEVSIDTDGIGMVYMSMPGVVLAIDETQIGELRGKLLLAQTKAFKYENEGENND